jgi:bifunctional UDP-N-acetylglucosamine pyrophosphorylase/glucosamine-1-phosphate N-acetyltransferase
MKDIVAVILAAGKGTRMHSDLPKVLHRIGGRPIIDYITILIGLLGIKRTIAVVGYRADLLKKHLGKKAECVIQKELLGTGDAIAQTKPLLKDFKGHILILYGDTPLLTKDTLQKLISHHLNTKAGCTLLTANLKNPTGYGRVVRNKDYHIIKIVEDSEASVYEKVIEEVNAGVCCFSAPELFKVLEEVKPQNKKKEYFLTDAVELLLRRGQKVESVIAEDSYETLGINSREDLAQAQEIARNRILDKLMTGGVTIIDPKTTFIDYTVEIAQDTRIHPFTIIEENVKIGKGCEIGPFCHIRPEVTISDKTRIGNFTEITRSKIGKGVNIRHYSYTGDATIGDNVNIGAGTTVANYDGKNKYETIIEDSAFIGCGTILVAPVKIGAGAVTGAGSVIPGRHNVPPGKVVVGVPAKILKR